MPQSDTLPLSNAEFLQSLIDLRLQSVRRQVFLGDADRDNSEERADGPTELSFSDNKRLSLSADTERLSVAVSREAMQVYGESYKTIDPSDNSFWRSKIGTRLVRIGIVSDGDPGSYLPAQWGIDFYFESPGAIRVKYVNSEEFPDSLVVAVRDGRMGQNYTEIAKAI